MLFAGIDGGQSSTTAVIGDEFHVLARGKAGPADEVGEGPDSTRLRDALIGALRDALRGAGLSPDIQFDAIVAGVSGYEGRIYGHVPQMPAKNFTLMHDAPIAHAGAFLGAPGVLVIAGTGSVAYTVARDGRTKTTGGWGYLFGDEGSAFEIVRSFVERSILESDAFAKPLCEYFGVGNLRELVRAFYSGEITRERFASFAPIALREPDFAEVAAQDLAMLARRAVIERPCAIAFTGGLFGNAALLASVHEHLRAHLPDCTLAEPISDAAEGALILARRT